MTASRAPGEPGGAGRRTSKSQFQAGAGVACTHGVRNTSCPTLTSTYASTTACFCPLAAYLCSHWPITFRCGMLAVCFRMMRATRVRTEPMELSRDDHFCTTCRFKKSAGPTRSRALLLDAMFLLGQPKAAHDPAQRALQWCRYGPRGFAHGHGLVWWQAWEEEAHLSSRA